MKLPPLPKDPKIFLGAGGVLLFIFVILTAGGFELLLKTVLTKMLRLVEGTDVFVLWRDVPVPMFLSFRLFNITNPESIESGDKAIVQEIGPYVYQEQFQKVDLTSPSNDTVRFRQTKTYFFRRDMSSGPETDQVTFINVLFLAVAKMAHDFTDNDFLLGQLDEILRRKGENLTRTESVGDLLFNGICIQTYVDLLNNPVVQAAAEGSDLHLPSEMADGKFGLLKGKNGSDSGWFEVYDGVTNVMDIGRIVTYKDEPKLKNWREGGHCNDLNGTDGTIFSPFMTEETIVQVFSPTICRSLNFSYEHHSETKGIPTLKYVEDAKSFQSPKTNPDNWCFAPVPKNTSDDNTWAYDGIFSLQPCLGAPLYLSSPHFLGAEDWVQNGVTGLNPKHEEHESEIYFHALSGSPIEAFIRIQFSMELTPWPAMASFADTHHSIFPLAWIEEHVVLDNHTLTKLRAVSTARKGFHSIKIFIIVLALVTILGGAFLLYKQRQDAVGNVDIGVDNEITIVASSSNQMEIETHL